MPRETPILLRPSLLVPGVVYAVTRYTVDCELVRAQEKYDVTADFIACARYLGWTPPPDEEQS